MLSTQVLIGRTHHSLMILSPQALTLLVAMDGPMDDGRLWTATQWTAMVTAHTLQAQLHPKTMVLHQMQPLSVCVCLSCSGSGSYSDVIDGIDWVTYQKSLKPSTPMVINMSLGGGYSSLVNNAVADAVAAGIIVVVAAGNEYTLASSKSPASAPDAITVGSSMSNDNISSFSNYGDAVDIFAPGSSIKSTTYGGGTGTMSGTSMASPHVAGIAAGYLADGNSASGFDAWLKSNAVSGCFAFSCIHHNKVGSV